MEKRARWLTNVTVIILCHCNTAGWYKNKTVGLQHRTKNSRKPKEKQKNQLKMTDHVVRSAATGVINCGCSGHPVEQSVMMQISWADVSCLSSTATVTSRREVLLVWVESSFWLMTTSSAAAHVKHMHSTLIRLTPTQAPWYHYQPNQDRFVGI